MNIRVQIGLRQQGHMPTVTKMLEAGKSWDEIGDAIGWEGSAVATWVAYDTAHLEEQITALEQKVLANAAAARDTRQRVATDWARAAFGHDQAVNLVQRGLRFGEEALEAMQAVAVPREQAHALVDYVYGRPVGELEQELGGVGVTLLALAEAAGLSADAAEAKEVARVLAKPVEFFAKRNAAKNEAGLLAAELRK